MQLTHPISTGLIPNEENREYVYYRVLFGRITRSASSYRVGNELIILRRNNVKHIDTQLVIYMPDVFTGTCSNICQFKKKFHPKGDGILPSSAGKTTLDVLLSQR